MTGAALVRDLLNELRHSWPSRQMRDWPWTRLQAFIAVRIELIKNRAFLLLRLHHMDFAWLEHLASEAPGLLIPTEQGSVMPIEMDFSLPHIVPGTHHVD